MTRLLVAVLISVTVTVSGCGLWRTAPDAAPPRGDEASEVVGDVLVGADDDGGTAEISKGQTLLVELDSNPTTAYSWRVTGIDEEVLEQEGEPDYESTGEPGAIGAGGIDTFRFTPVEAGSTELEMVYERPEDEESATKRFTLTVVVR